MGWEWRCARISRVLARRSRAARELLTSALVVIGVLGASGGPHTAAADEAAYATVLKFHVRPGSVSGIRLHLVYTRTSSAQHITDEER